MKDDHLKSISDDFDSLRNKNDFVNLLNRVHKILSEDNSSKDPFKLSTINFYAFHHKNSYFVFDVLKKNGTARKIRAPHPYLKIIQQCVNFILASKFNSHHTSHGFLLGKSILTNARTHVGKGYVLNVDIKDFFHTISFRRVKTVLGMHPFNLSGEREEIAFILSNLCCNRGVLPQGAPSSPILTNIVCQRLDRKLFQLAKNWKVRYSRYADDISFSCNEDVFKEKFLEELESIIKYEGFDLNPSKTRIQNWKQRQEVTGIIVNRKINVNREYIRSIRAIIYFSIYN
jgi:retron-type reverse transcriptase